MSFDSFPELSRKIDRILNAVENALPQIQASLTELRAAPLNTFSQSEPVIYAPGSPFTVEPVQSNPVCSALPNNFSVAPGFIQTTNSSPQVSRTADDLTVLNTNERLNGMMETLRAEIQAALPSGLHQTTSALVGQANDNSRMLMQLQSTLENVQMTHRAEIEQLINENNRLREAIQTLVNSIRR